MMTKTIMDEYDAGYSDAKHDLQIQLDKLIRHQEQMCKIYDYIDEHKHLNVLKDVRRKLFGSYEKKV
jgi:hypothetical protein